MINTALGHRGYNLMCYWYKRYIKGVGDSDKLIHKEYTDIFYAKIIADEVEEGTDMFNSLHYDSHRLTIETRDLINGIGSEDKIVINNKEYIVMSVGSRLLTGSTMYMRNPVKITTIVLRG